MATKLSHKQGRALVEKGIITEAAFQKMIEEGAVSQGSISGEIWVATDKNGVEIMPKFSFQAIVPQGTGFRAGLDDNLQKFMNSLDKLYEKHFEKKDSSYKKEAVSNEESNPEEDKEF